MRAKVNFTLGRKVVSTLMSAQTNRLITRNQTDQPGNILETVGRARKPEARPLITLQDQPRASSLTNDNYCVNSLQGRLLAGSQGSSQRQTTDTCVNLNVVPLVHYTRAFAKERSKSRVSRLFFSPEKLQNKICERCFLCHSVVLCQTCNKCQKCCLKSTCRGQTSKFLADLAESAISLLGV